jgi:hypothetical protein
MNPILINQHVIWLQPVTPTPLIVGQHRTIPYPMWYIIVPSFVLMDLNMYSMHYSRIKGPDSLISTRRKGYVVNVTQPKQMPPIEQLLQNLYLFIIPILGL